MEEKVETKVNEARFCQKQNVNFPTYADAVTYRDQILSEQKGEADKDFKVRIRRRRTCFSVTLALPVSKNG